MSETELKSDDSKQKALDRIWGQPADSVDPEPEPEEKPDAS